MSIVIIQETHSNLISAIVALLILMLRLLKAAIYATTRPCIEFLC